MQSHTHLGESYRITLKYGYTVSVKIVAEVALSLRYQQRYMREIWWEFLSDFDMLIT